MKYSVMITGGNGMLATELGEQFPKLFVNDEVEIYSYVKSVFNINFYEDWATNLDHVSKQHFASKDPHKYVFLINCAAMTKLDVCNAARKEAMQVNAHALRNMGIATQQHSWLKSFHISTDYVFDGTVGDSNKQAHSQMFNKEHSDIYSNYNEHSNPNPLSYYAKTKWAGELILNQQNADDRTRIIRTSFCRKDKWPHPKAFMDKYTSADYVDIIALKIASAVVMNHKWTGTLHVGTERKTFFDLAKKISPEVVSCSVKDFKDIPVDTSFDLTKLKRIYE